MQIKTEKSDNKVIFSFSISAISDRDTFIKDLNENMNMYSGGLYSRLRFDLGVVHNGYCEIDGDNIKIVFTTNEKYIDDIQREFEVYLDKFDK